MVEKSLHILHCIHNPAASLARGVTVARTTKGDERNAFLLASSLKAGGGNP